MPCCPCLSLDSLQTYPRHAITDELYKGFKTSKVQFIWGSGLYRWRIAALPQRWLNPGYPPNQYLAVAWGVLLFCPFRVAPSVWFFDFRQRSDYSGNTSSSQRRSWQTPSARLYSRRWITLSIFHTKARKSTSPLAGRCFSTTGFLLHMSGLEYLCCRHSWYLHCKITPRPLVGGVKLAQLQPKRFAQLPSLYLVAIWLVAQ